MDYKDYNKRVEELHEDMCREIRGLAKEFIRSEKSQTILSSYKTMFDWGGNYYLNGFVFETDDELCLCGEFDGEKVFAPIEELPIESLLEVIWVFEQSLNRA